MFVLDKDWQLNNPVLMVHTKTRYGRHPAYHVQLEVCVQSVMTHLFHVMEGSTVYLEWMSVLLVLVASGS